MVVIIYGTTGELIKLFPLINSIPAESRLLLDTRQQPEQLDRLRQEMELPYPDIVIGNGHKGHDLSGMAQIPGWFFGVSANLWKNYRKIKKATKNNEPSLVIVHGDTITTVIGAIYGRLLGLKVAHVEAGLRSFNWFHPFPEEIDRHIVSRVANFHFAPGDTPMHNLRDVKGEKINTKLNTVKDSLLLAAQQKGALPKGIPKKYGVVSIHRNELLSQTQELETFLSILQEYASRGTPLVYLDHPVTAKKIQSLKLDHYLEGKNIVRIPKLSYNLFMALLNGSDFVVTDSGGLQEESAYLNIPCLIHRKATEREEGLGANVVLSKYDERIVRDFMDDPEKFRSKQTALNVSPTKIIRDFLAANHFIKSK